MLDLFSFALKSTSLFYTNIYLFWKSRKLHEIVRLRLSQCTIVIVSELQTERCAVDAVEWQRLTHLNSS